MWSRLGYAYLDQQSPKLAVDAFTRALKAVPNDAFSLAGLVRAHHALGETQASGRRAGAARVRVERRRARPAMAARRARDRRQGARRSIARPAKQRSYRKTTLDQFGPAIWTPFAAPALDVADPTGKRTDARSVPRQERDPDVLSRRRLRALRQAGQGPRRAGRRVGAARHRRDHREPGRAGEERQVAGARRR